MMYCDLAGMSARFGEDEIIALTDRDDTGTVDEAVLQQALIDATEEINSYIAARYTVPLSAVPDLLVRLCADIARYLLMDNRVTEEVEKRYNRAVQTLRDLSMGRAELAIPNQPNHQGEVSTVKGDADRLFTMGSLKDF